MSGFVRGESARSRAAHDAARRRHTAVENRLLAGTDHATVAALVRLTRTERGLRATWLQTYEEAEPAFARALAERAGLPADDLRPAIQAAMFYPDLATGTEPAATPHSALAAVAEGMG